jgi:hypothetical protein
VRELREHRVTPHFACKHSSVIDQRTTRHLRGGLILFLHFCQNSAAERFFIQG